jgi:potassium channel
VAYWWTEEVSTRSAASSDFNTWDTVVDFLFLFDVFLNFNSGYLKLRDQLIVMNRKRIAWKYARTWFLVDLAAALPYDLIAGQNGVTAYRLPRLLRVLRIFKLVR